MVGIIATLVAALVILMVAIFVVYIFQGISSVETYSPPIGPVMSFEFNVAELGGIVITAIFGLALFLHHMPKLRERLDDALKGRKL